MGLWKQFCGIENKFIWTLLGLLIGAISLAASLYGYIHEKKTSIKYEIVNEINAFEINKEFQDIKIEYKGEQFSKEKTLKYVQIKVINDGEVDITQNLFDTKIDWGLEISNAEIIDEAKIDSTSSDYIRQNIDIKTYDNKIIFNKIQFERNSFFTINVLIVQKSSEKIKIIPSGKILRLNRISIEERIPNNNDVSFLSALFFGGIFINVIRSILNFFIVFALLILFTFLIATIFEKMQSISSNRKLSKFKEQIKNKRITVKQLEFISDKFSIDGIRSLKMIYVLLKNGDENTEIYKKLRDLFIATEKMHKLSKSAQDEIPEIAEALYIEEIPHPTDSWDILDSLDDIGAISFHEDKEYFTANKPFIEALNVAISTLENQ